LPIALLNYCEAELAKNELGLAGGLTATELFGLKYATDGVAGGQPVNRLGSVSLVIVDEFVAGWSAAGMVQSSIEVGQRSENVPPRQSCWNGLEHGLLCQ